MKFPPLPLLAACLFATTLASPAQQFPPQGDTMIPEASPEGVLFRVSAPDTAAVYLAGDFNSWGENKDGEITNEKYKMEGPDDAGVFKKSVTIPPGQHQFKFALNGQADKWFAPDWAQELDGEGNAVIYVTTGGRPLLKSDVNPDWKPAVGEGAVTFRVYRPGAQTVYLAGDFNEWAKNESGVVKDAAFAMEGPDEGGVWTKEVPLGAGKHAYKYVIDGSVWEPDPNAETDNEGHSVVTVP